MRTPIYRGISLFGFGPGTFGVKSVVSAVFSNPLRPKIAGSACFGKSDEPQKPKISSSNPVSDCHGVDALSACLDGAVLGSVGLLASILRVVDRRHVAFPET